jgi:hypothetical protein
MHGLAHIFIFYDANKFGSESLFEIPGDLWVLLKFQFTLDIRWRWFNLMCLSSLRYKQGVMYQNGHHTHNFHKPSIVYYIILWNQL